MRKKRIVRIFISSTFQEMLSERDEIQQFVFTKIRFWARKLGLLVLPIDLRWGITEKDILEGKLAQQCEEAIRFCEPYFVALLGNTYGTDSKEVLGVVDKSYYGKSITDYEITKGIIETQNTKALVYNISYSHTKENIVKKIKLKKLKKRLAEQVDIITINIRERLITTMLNDIKTLLESEYTEEFYHDPVSKDDFFVQSCYYSQYYNRFFFNGYYNSFLDHAFSLCLINSKENDTISTFMYNLAFIKRKSDNIIVFYHDFRATSYLKSYDGLLKHLIDFISSKTNTYYYTSGNFYEDLCCLLASFDVNQFRFVFFVDSLFLIDRVDADKIVNLFTLNLFMQHTVYLSFYPGAEYFSNIPEYIVPELTVRLAKSFIKYYLHEYKKDNNDELTSNIINHLLASKSYDISFLQLLLSEVLMRGCPSNQILNEIDRLTSTQSIDEVYGLIINRLTDNISTPNNKNFVIRDICVLLSIANDYLLYEDFQAILSDVGYRPQQINEGLELLNELLSICENRYRFRFTGIIQVIKHNYLERFEEIESNYYLNYLRKASTTLHRVMELVHLYQRTGNEEKAIDRVLEPDVFFLLYHDNMAFLYSVTNKKPDYSSQKVIELVNKLNSKKMHDYEIVIDFIINCGNYSTASIILDKIAEKEILKPLALLRKGYLLRETGDYLNAIICLEQFLAEYHHRTEWQIKAYDYLSYCYGKRNQMEKSIDYSKKAINLRRNNLTKYEFDLPVSLNSLAYYFYNIGQYDDALPLYEEACQIRIRFLGAKHPRVANNMNNIGKIYLRLKKFNKAESKFSESLDILTRTVGASHIYSLICKMNLIMCECILSNDCNTQMLSDAQEIKNKLSEHMNNNDYIAYSNMLIGVLQTRMCLLNEAMVNLQLAHKYYTTILGMNSYEAQFISKIIDDPNKRMEDYFE